MTLWAIGCARPGLLLIADTHVPKRARDLPHAVWDEVARRRRRHARGRLGGARRCSMRSRRGPSASSRAGATTTATSCARGCPNAPTRPWVGVRFTVVHETGGSAGRDARMAKQYPDTDVLVFGHSHIPWDTTATTGLRLLNPGSPTDRRRQPFCTYMTATVDDGELSDVTLHRLERGDA